MFSGPAQKLNEVFPLSFSEYSLQNIKLETDKGDESIITDTVDEEKGDEALPRPIFPTDPNDKSEGNGASKDEKYHAPPPFVQEGKQNLHKVATLASPHNSTTANNRGELKSSILEMHTQSQRIHDQHEVTSQIDADTFASSSSISLKQVMLKKPDSTETVVEVIELDSRSDGESQSNTAVEQKMLEDLQSCVWLISGPDASTHSSSSHDERRPLHWILVTLICGLVILVISEAAVAYKYWQKRKKQQEQARFMKQFEDNDDIEDELCIGTL